jgi:bifunctional non-homologous end joining protein LigD
MPKKPLPDFVAPMQASSVKEPFDSPDWIFETKLDGYRAIAVIDATGKARIWSRNHLPLEPKFPTIQDAVRQLKLCSTILDGEMREVPFSCCCNLPISAFLGTPR